MRDTALLAPVFALAAWTMLMLLLVARRRLTCGVSPREFALGESVQVPLPVVLANRNYMNLLELPLLFYLACLIGAFTGVAPALAVPLAWTYVGLRVVHSLIHVTYNRVRDRFAAFALSNGVLLALWILLGVRLFG